MNNRTGNRRHSMRERGDDVYETPTVATQALLRVEEFDGGVIWEPACGPGAITRVLRANRHPVFASDLRDYNSPDQDLAGVDFLAIDEAPVLNCGAIVTNPPFNLAAQFVGQAIAFAPKVAMLLRLAFLESDRRSPILDGGALARVHVFRKRLPMMHRQGWTGKRSTSAMAFAWFVWERGHKGPAELHRISW